MNKNWQAAARDLRPHAFLLYLYLASNADNYNLALSPAAISKAVGMPSSTYSDQFKILVEKGYLVLRDGKLYDFYEVPKKPSTANEVYSSDVASESPTGIREINNSTNESPNITDREKDTARNELYLSPKRAIEENIQKTTETHTLPPTVRTGGRMDREAKKRIRSYFKEAEGKIAQDSDNKFVF